MAVDATRFGANVAGDGPPHVGPGTNSRLPWPKQRRLAFCETVRPRSRTGESVVDEGTLMRRPSWPAIPGVEHPSGRIDRGPACRDARGASRGAALLAVALLGIAAHGPAGAAEGFFRGDAARRGVYAEPAPPGIDHVRWSFHTGGRVLSSPVVADRMVYVGSNDHFLYALAADSGQMRWKYQTAANVAGSAAVAGQSVYFLSLDGNAYALDARTGVLRWKFATGGESRVNGAGLYGWAPSREVVPDPWDFFLSSPLVADGTVYFGSGDHHVYALDAASGRLRWKYRTGDVVHSSPALAGKLLYVGSWDGVLYALDARSGRLAWRFSTQSDPTRFMQGLPASPAVADGVVVIGSRDNRIYGLDAGSGKLLWQQENHGSWVVASAAIQDGVAYVTTSDSAQLRALDLRTGAPRFDVPYLAYGFSSPALAGGHAYFGTFDGMVYDVDLAARQVHSRFQVAAAREHPGLLSPDGRLNLPAIYAPLGPDGNSNNTLDATVVAIDRMLGLGAVLSSPAVAGGVVYVGSADGSVYALD